MKYIEENLQWILDNFPHTLPLFVAGVVVGWAAAKMFYHERIQILRENSGQKHHRTEKQFSYPKMSENGINILSNTVESIAKSEKVSLHAIIPGNKTLTVKLTAVPSTLGQTYWTFRVSSVHNWRADMYESDNGGSQQFHAVAGFADLQLHFPEAGKVKLIVHEGEGRSDCWNKTIQVL